MISKIYSESEENQEMLNEKIQNSLLSVGNRFGFNQQIEGTIFQFKNGMLYTCINVGKSRIFLFEGKYKTTGEQILKQQGPTGLSKIWGLPITCRKGQVFTS